MNDFDIQKCRKLLKPWITRTPLVEAESLSQLTGKKVYLKLESLQKTGSFKFRGAMNCMLNLSKDALSRGVITASSGNHGLAMSLAGRLVGANTTVVMPENACPVKKEKAQAYGATLILHGSSYDDAYEYAKDLAAERDLSFVPSFDHPAIVEGQGTIVAEILQDLPDVDAVFSPVGGGGLLSGLLLGAATLGTKLEALGVEPTGACSMKTSLDEGRISHLSSMDTLADGVKVGAPGALNFEIVRRYSPTMVLVDDSTILKAQKCLLQEERLVVEGAGAVSVAGLLTEVPKGAKNVVCIVSGGNVDLPTLQGLVNR